MLDARTAQIAWYATSMQAYTKEEYQPLLEQTEFCDVEFRASLGGEGDTFQSELTVITAHKP